VSEECQELKVLYIHSSDELYGSDIGLLNLVRHLDQRRFEPLVILPSDVRYQGLLSRELSKVGIKYRYLKLGVLRRKYFHPLGIITYMAYLLSSTKQVMRIIRQERIDLVHSNTSAVWEGALACALTRTPHLWHVREIIIHPAFLWRITARMLDWFADGVIAISEAVKAHICAAVPSLASKVHVVHNGVDTKLFNPTRDGTRIRREFGVETSQILVGMVGRVSPWKGQEYLLQSAAIVARRYPQVKFAFVGGAFPGLEFRIDQLRERARLLGLDSRVIISTWRSDMPDVWAAYDIAVLPSLEPEPFGRSVLEAMATGKPVVATAHGGPLELVRDGVTGLLVPPGDVEAMADAICRLVRNKDMRLAMGLAGRKRVQRFFTVGRVVNQIEHLYEQYGMT